MGRFIPLDYDVATITDSTERRVAETMRDKLSDSWFIIPNLDIAKHDRPYEIDVLLLHEDYGIFAFEVKAGPVVVREGIWSRRGIPFTTSPPKQSQNSAFALRDELRKHDQSLTNIHVLHAVVFPDVTEGDFDGLTEITREQLFLKGDLENLRDSVIRLATSTHRAQSLNETQKTAILEVIRPNVTFDWDPDSLATYARLSLDRIMREQTRALATLDLNTSVYVDGPAGTGKTRLALQWAERAIERGDRTLVTSFNIPLGEFLRDQLEGPENLSIGYFEQVISTLPGLPHLKKPDGPTGTWEEVWYGLTFPRHVLRHLDSITVRFDTIIVDEVQDFHALWVHVLIALLDPEGPRRLLAVGDENQNLYQREGVKVMESLGSVRAELTTNCRNSQAIGRFLTSLGGAPVATASPEGELFFMVVDATDNAISESGIKQLCEELRTMRDDEVRDMSRVLVATATSSDKLKIQNSIVPDLSFVEWGFVPDEGDSIVCETVHRAKGLEYDVVYLVATNAAVRENLMYVGASRAISRLVIVGPQELVDRFDK